MNEQIFKLALKAMDFQGAVDIDTELKLTNSELAKFAELIVLECMRLVGNKTCPNYAYKAIENHFGITQ
jgi:hypothetical protein